MHRFVQHSGRLFMPTIVVAELYTWAYQRRNPNTLLRSIRDDLLTEVDVLAFDLHCAMRFGEVRGALLQRGISVSRMDLMIASVALVHDLTLVTHNTADYQHVPGLRLDDWIGP
jgi:tRNA(fMet)-specific endonuclease VapC